jgi:hypothetical protein
MNHLKIKLVVLALVVISLLVLFGGSIPILAESPNPAVPTVVLPTPIAKPTTGAVSPAKVPTRALVAPTATKPAEPKVSARTAFGPSGGYGSGIACVNLGTSSASIALTFYPADNATSVLTYTDPTAIPAGSSRNYFTPSTPPGLPSSFAGSAVVSSNQPMACNVNTQRTDSGVGSTTTPARIGTSEGVDSAKAGTTLYAPQLLKTFSATNWNSYLSVQNTESTAQSVTVSYKDRFGTAYPAANETVSIPAQSSHIFYQDANANLPSNFLGGAVISSAGKLAAVANFYNGAANYANSQLQSYTAFGAGANKIFVPRFVRNYYGYNGGLSVQNIGAGATTVQIKFNFNGTTYTYNSPSIAAGASLALYATSIAELNPVDSLVVSLRTGSAVIQAAAGGTVVAIVNEDNRGTCNGASCPPIPANQVGQGSTYEAFADGTQTTTVFLMQVPSHVGSQDYSGGFQIANTTAGAGTCNITFPASPAANQTGVALAANGSISRYAPNVAGLSNPYNSSVKVTCTVPVVGISNFSARSTSYYGDTSVAAPGINQ